jgi:hypothetical protein
VPRSRCGRVAPSLSSPASLHWEPIVDEIGEVAAIICSGCLTATEEAMIEVDRAEALRRIRGDA